MGSSYSGNNGGIGIKGNFDCGGIFESSVLLPDSISLDFYNVKIGDDIKLKLIKDRLPRLEVVKLIDDTLIGLVPPTYSKLIKCIEEGWKYYGKITNIEGDEFDPMIYIRIQGEF